ncbi:ATP-binding protein [Rubrivivax sp. RP6-9]|uniref:ATP-binding protein n=1 Tax=Rubrivivax sp. RP6-9 TaxID=3415750 RepID=UPI003CC5E122
MSDIQSPPGEAYVFGQFRLLPAQRSLLDGSTAVRIGSRALDVLVVLVQRAGEVVSKEELIRTVWPNTVIDEAGLRVHIAALRKALAEAHSGVRHIANVPLRGYCFVVPVQRQALLPAATPGPPAGRVALPSAPPRLTRLIGRDEAVAAAARTLLQRRLVTVVGPGGMGKTSVALVAAERCAASFEDGVCFVDLATVAEGALVTVALATALGAQLPVQDPVGGLLAWLTRRRMLVLLDNCEHVIDAAALLAERLVGGTAGVSVLATSREPLRARGEWVQRLGSLPSPPVSSAPAYAAALAYPAFELFVERAMASLDGLVFGDADVPVIGQLCRSLDGMPLALELVAARVGMFGLRELAERLDDHLSLPTLGHRTALPRHQGLRATMDWSFGLLPPDEQRLLGRLSVFRERFTIDAATAVAGDAATGRPVVTALLMHLVAKSLVVAEPGEDMAAYRLLQTTRSYAAERLLASGEQGPVRRRHALHCLTLLDAVTRDSEVLVPARWRDRYGRRLDDVRAALDWAFGSEGDVELGVALLAHSPSLWFGMSLAHEYLQRLAQVPQPLPAACRDGPLDVRMHLVIGQVALAIHGATPDGRAALERARALSGRLGEPTLQVRALWSLFSLHALRGEYVQARLAAEELGEVARRAGDRASLYVHHRVMALCLHCLGDQREAQRHARLALEPEAVALQPSQGTLFHLDHRTAALTQMARVLWLQGRTAQALKACQDAIDTARGIDHPLSLTYALSYAACPVALWSGHDPAAEALVDELEQTAHAHHLVFWQSWPPLFRRVLAARRGAPPAEPLEPGRLHFSHVDMLPTLQPGLVDDIAGERVRQGLNAWCAAEIRRVRAESAALAGDSAARAELVGAWTQAVEQDARAWALRCACSLAHVALKHGQDLGPALDRLLEALAAVDDEPATADLLRARSLRGELERAAG